MAVQNSPARAAIDVGSVIAGTYTIEALIGRGGMGAVFLASHARLPGKKVAIKVLHAEMSGDEIDARFKREAQIASMLSHPNIVHIEDYNVTAEGMPYLVLEYLQGESLAQRLRRGPLSVEQTGSILRQVGSALAAAHLKGIVHRDLKPQNIFLVPMELEGRSIEIAKVLDFGISKMRDSQTVKTQDSALLGTPQYMAPEQATGQHANVDARTDIFALGVIAYEMLSGQPAFSGASIPEVVFKVVYEQPVPLAQHVPSLPAAITAAVQRAMSKASADRFESVGELVEALTGQPLIAGRLSGPIPPPEIGFATGSRHTGNDAFAQTMGSGDHGASPLGAPASAAAVGIAATVASQNQLLPVVGSGTAPSAPATPRRRTGLIVGALLGAVAIAVVAAVALQGSKQPTQVAKAEPPATEARVIAPATQAPGNAPAAASDPAPTPGSGAGSASARTGAGTGSADTKAPATKPRGTPAKPEVDDDSGDGGDELAAQKLKDADAAMRASQWPRAEQLANAVTTSQDATPRQRSRASMIHGMVQCIGRNNEEAAGIDLRKVTVAGMRRKLLAVCRQAGFLRGAR